MSVHQNSLFKSLFKLSIWTICLCILIPISAFAESNNLSNEASKKQTKEKNSEAVDAHEGASVADYAPIKKSKRDLQKKADRVPKETKQKKYDDPKQPAVIRKSNRHPIADELEVDLN